MLQNWTISRVCHESLLHGGLFMKNGEHYPGTSWDLLCSMLEVDGRREAESSLMNSLPFTEHAIPAFERSLQSPSLWVVCNLLVHLNCFLQSCGYQLLVRSLCIWMLVAINRVCNFFPYQLQGNPRQSLNNLCIWFWKLSESRCVIWVWYWACSRIGFWSKQAFVLACVIYCFLLLWLPALTLFPPLVTNSYFFSLLQLASPLQLPEQNLELGSQLLFLNYFYT